MAQDLDAPESSLMIHRLIIKSFVVVAVEVSVFDWLTVLNSSDWYSFLTSCPLLSFEGLLLCVYYNLVFMVFCLLDSHVSCRLSTNTFSSQN